MNSFWKSGLHIPRDDVRDVRRVLHHVGTYGQVIWNELAILANFAKKAAEPLLCFRGWVGLYSCYLLLLGVDTSLAHYES